MLLFLCSTVDWCKIDFNLWTCVPIFNVVLRQIIQNSLIDLMQINSDLFWVVYTKEFVCKYAQEWFHKPIGCSICVTVNIIFNFMWLSWQIPYINCDSLLQNIETITLKMHKPNCIKIKMKVVVNEY